MAHLVTYVLGTTALVLPIDRDTVLYPGNGRYEELVDPLRNDRCHVYGLVRTYGVLPESRIAAHPEFLEAFSSVPFRQADRASIFRTRAWIEEFGRRYDKIVFVRRFTTDPVNKIWTDAIRGTMGKGGRPPDPELLDRIKVITAHEGKINDSIFRRRLSRACRVSS